MDKLLGFSPDADPTVPGVVTYCANMVPSEKGFSGAPSPVTPTDVPVLAAACIGGVVATKLDDTRRVFAGTTTKLYELVSGSWTDVSSATYTGGSDTRWVFTQFGDSTIAANLSDPMQRSNGSGAFADISGAPKAKIVFAVGSFVMALNTSDGAYGVNPDRWWCSSVYDDTDWTPSTTTQATTGRLVSSPGRITAGGKLGDYAVAYKEKAIHLAQYVGAPVVWDWQQIPGGDAGCVGLEAWCDVGGAHFIVGMDNLWLFDGSRPVPIGVGQVRDWFFSNSDPAARHKTRCAFDRQKNLVWVFFASSGSSVPDSALTYHLGTKQWGLVSIDSEAVMNFVSSGVTIDTLSSVSGTMDGLSSYSYDSQAWLSGGRSLAIVNTSHQLQTLTGDTVTCGYTTGDYGDDDIVSLLSKIRIRFAPGEKPSSASVLTSYKFTEGDSLTPGSSSTLADGKFDVLDNGRWHRAAFTFTGRCTVMAQQMSLSEEGSF